MTEIPPETPAVETATAQPKPEPPVETITETATRLTTELAESRTPETQRRKPGRPRGPYKPRKPSGSRPDDSAARAQAESVVRAQAVALLTIAFTATFGALVQRWDMFPPFDESQGRALAEAWQPVVDLYVDRGGPWAQAATVTAVVMLPYILQGIQRGRGGRKGEPNAQAPAQTA
jgi:hypothetical protein